MTHSNDEPPFIPMTVDDMIALLQNLSPEDRKKQIFTLNKNFMCFDPVDKSTCQISKFKAWEHHNKDYDFYEYHDYGDEEEDKLVDILLINPDGYGFDED